MRLLVLNGSTTGRSFLAERGDKTFDVVSGVGFLNFQGLGTDGSWVTVRKEWYSSPEKVTLGDRYDVWRVVPSTVQTAFVVYCDDAEAASQDYTVTSRQNAQPFLMPSALTPIAEARLWEEVNESTTVPTSPAGGNEIVSPSVVFHPDKWNGYFYWMMTTPYTGSDSNLENPEIFCSNDGLTWETPAGVTNPLVASPAGSDYNSDCNLTFSPDGSELLCVYRTYLTTTETLSLIRSSNGSTWTAPVVLKTFTTASERFQSPNLIWNPSTAKWRVYLVEFVAAAPAYAMKYMESTNLESGWGSLSAVTYTLPSGITSLWQADVRRSYDGTLWCLMQTGDGSGGKLYLMKSIDDGANWTFSPSLWPKRTVYGSCIVPREGYFEAFIGYLSGPMGMERSRILFDRTEFQNRLNSWRVLGISSAATPLGDYLAVDTFNRADAAVGNATSGQTWTVESGTINVASNLCAASTSGKIYIDVGVADVEITLDWATANTSGQAFVILRRTDNSNFWRIGTVSGVPSVQKIVSGSVDTTWSFNGITEASGDRLRVVARGSNIRAYWNDKCWASINDATGYDKTQHGIQLNNGTHRMDNFICARA